MDEARTLLIAACSSLARLHMRLIALWHWRRRTGPSTWSLSDPHWRVEELDPPSPWLDACAPRTEIANLIPAIALVQAHLLAMIETEGPINGMDACTALHHLSFHSTTWSSAVRRLADRLGVQLPDEPREATHLASLEQRPLPKRRRGQPG